MPIPRAQFDEGLDDTSYKVIEFLRAHSDQAFEVSEVAEEVYTSPLKQPTTSSAELAARAKRMEFYLADLVQKGVVERKTIGERTYYCIHRG